jgi:hypothetical protein
MTVITKTYLDTKRTDLKSDMLKTVVGLVIAQAALVIGAVIAIAKIL